MIKYWKNSGYLVGISILAAFVLGMDDFNFHGFWGFVGRFMIIFFASGLAASIAEDRRRA